MERPLGGPVQACGVAAALFWTALSSSAAPGQENLLPERPSLPLDVVATVEGRPAHGQVSDNRSTFDGRLRIIGNRGTAGHRIFVSRAEVFRTDLASERRSSDGPLHRVDVAGFHASTFAEAIPDHVTICDPHLAAGVPKNPYSCVQGGKLADCYDISILVVVHAALPGEPEARSELWTTPVTITVTRPKTSRADIAKLELRGPPVRSPIRQAPRKSGDILSEPVVSGDGRLLFLNSGDTLLYSAMGAAEVPCDARNWKRLDHVSRMHDDSRVSRYGIGLYPIRDSENRPIKAGRPVRGAYPWIDRQGNNLFFTQVGGTGLFYRNPEGKLKARFEVLNRPRKRRIETGGPTRLALSYFGLWSQGKIIVPDGRFNNTDFHLGKADYEPLVRLYRGPGDPVNLGSGTMSKINTIENQWNYRPAFLPRAPRDVAWWISASNEMTGEIVFDDVLDLGSLIYSPMNAAVDNKRLAWRDGFDYRKNGGYRKTPRIQNAAASQLNWKLPAFAKLVGARLEPVAAGGTIGKGLWLDGDRSRLEYSIPDQDRAAMAAAVWTTAVSMDSRDLSRRRRLLDYPDGSWVDLEPGRLILGDGRGSQASVEIPASLQPRLRSWTHLAFVSRAGEIDVYVQGFKLASRAGAFLRVEPGPLRLGKPVDGAASGFHGWIDELRVVSGIRSPELICNYAGGTLRGLDAASSSGDFALAGSYPRTSHEEISALLASGNRPSWERYLCDLERDAADSCLNRIHRLGAPSEADCVRAGLLFPEGPLYADLPRPDSRGNAFCRTCHTSGHPAPGLRTARSLRAGEEATALADDRRRQPFQAPIRIHGFLPEGFLGLAEGVESPPEGLALDPLLYPSARKALGSDRVD